MNTIKQNTFREYTPPKIATRVQPQNTFRTQEPEEVKRIAPTVWGKFLTQVRESIAQDHPNIQERELEDSSLMAVGIIVIVAGTSIFATLYWLIWG